MKLSVQLLSQKHKREPIDDLQDAQYVFGFVMAFVVQWFCTWAFHVWKINTWKLFVEKIRGMVTDLLSLPMLANAASGTFARHESSCQLERINESPVTGSRRPKRKSRLLAFQPNQPLTFFQTKTVMNNEPLPWGLISGVGAPDVVSVLVGPFSLIFRLG